MSLPTAASDHYRTQQRLVVATLNLVRSVWARMSFDDVDGSWVEVGPKLFGIVSSAQLGAARNGSRYVPEALAEQGDSVKTLGLVRPQGFAGFASNGGSLMDLLSTATFRVKQAQSLDAGRAWVDMVAHASVQDASRQAAGVAIASTPGASWVRAVNPPCCQRCAVLAGRQYRYSEGFKRHPRCDCFHIPTTVAQPNGFGQAVEPDQIKDLTVAQRAAIDEGADMNRVINSHRANKVSANRLTTTEAAKRGQKRLTPEGIYRIASDREESVRLLRQHGYLL